MISIAKNMIEPRVTNETLGPNAPYKYDTTIGPNARESDPKLVNKPIIKPWLLKNK